MEQGAKLEVESVIRSVCDEVLNDKDANANTRDLRAKGLKLMGEVSLCDGETNVTDGRVQGFSLDQEAWTRGRKGKSAAAGAAAAC